MRVWDWQREEAYGYTRDYNLHEWAWEFLRRNASYRSAYAEFATQLDELKRWQGDYKAPDCHALANYTALLHDEASLPWGLAFPADPIMPARAVNLLWTHQAGVEVLSKWKAPDPPPEFFLWPWPGYPKNIVLSFDFLYPVETLIAIATERLRACSRRVQESGDLAPLAQPDWRKVKRGQFVLYARLLDAALDGATMYRIADELFKGKRADKERSARFTMATAQRMAQSGYRDLLLLPPNPGARRSKANP